jgi:hypothetical protein
MDNLLKDHRCPILGFQRVGLGVLSGSLGVCETAVLSFLCGGIMMDLRKNE